MPVTEDERHGVRAWSALAELVRGEQVRGRPDPAALFAGMVADERARIEYDLARALGRRPDPLEAQATIALVTGLRHELAAQEPPLTAEEACVILRAQVDHQRGRPPGADQEVRSA